MGGIQKRELNTLHHYSSGNDMYPLNKKEVNPQIFSAIQQNIEYFFMKIVQIV
jgi:hypothetical protein